MKNTQGLPGCQITSVQQLAMGPQERISLVKSIRLWIRKTLGPSKVRRIKKFANNFLNWYAQLRRKPAQPVEPVVHLSSMTLSPGDYVRVRSEAEIFATLNHCGQLKGCSFAPEMKQYCGTNQRVLKCVERFVDERDFRARKTKGIVLLEGINCQGTASLGKCDRNCYYFWREEWLEKIPNS